MPPDAAQMMGWIEAICAQGVRRPGTAADGWCERFIAARFREFGLEDVRLEPVPTTGWFGGTASLTVDGLTLDGFTTPYTAATPGLEAELARLGVDDVAGKLAIDEIELMRLPYAALLPEATAAHDPDGDFEALVQVLPFGPQMQAVLEPALAAGAAGYVGLLTGFLWDTSDYYVPYNAAPLPIPAAWFSRRDAERVAGARRALLATSGEVRPVVSNNVVGHLKGRSDEWVIIGSHHDGPWASAVEDASGVALLLAQAALWSKVPEAERPHNLLFFAGAAHMAGSPGHGAFVEARADQLARTVLEVHLEHAAAECGEDLVPTGKPEPAWWFTSRNARLEGAVIEALRKHDLRRSLVLRPDIFAPFPPTDGGHFHALGVPLVSFLAAPMYLFDSRDTIDKIHVPSLEPVTAAAFDIIAATAGETAASMRDGITAGAEPPILPELIAQSAQPA